jgi:hypothetical protein
VLVHDEELGLDAQTHGRIALEGLGGGELRVGVDEGVLGVDDDLHGVETVSVVVLLGDDGGVHEDEALEAVPDNVLQETELGLGPQLARDDVVGGQVGRLDEANSTKAIGVEGAVKSRPIDVDSPLSGVLPGADEGDIQDGAL